MLSKSKWLLLSGMKIYPYEQGAEYEYECGDSIFE